MPKFKIVIKLKDGPPERDRVEFEADSYEQALRDAEERYRDTIYEVDPISPTKFDEGYIFLRKFNSDRFIKTHDRAMRESGDRPYNIKNVRTFNRIVRQLNEWGHAKVDPYVMAVWTLKECIQKADDLKPFENGNHRTGWTLMTLILNKFDIHLDVDKEPKKEFCQMSIFMLDEDCINWLKLTSP